MAGAFFEPDGDGFAATELTRGPWSREHQHAGPLTALVGREIAREVGEGWQLGRLTLELLRPLSIAPLRVRAEVVRPGRSVRLVQADVEIDGQRSVLARAWAIRRGALELPNDGAGPVDITPPAPGAGRPGEFFPGAAPVGYHTAMEIHFLEGAFATPGPARAWMRMDAQLVAGEEPTQLERVLAAADSGNGVSSPLDFRRYLFVNTDLTVSLLRVPDGDWVLLDAVSHVRESGIGLTETALFDERGRIGRAAQTLFVASRSS